MTTETPYTGTQVAALYGVHVSTVVRWADEGKIPSFRTPGGQRRYPRAAIDLHLATAQRTPQTAGAGDAPEGAPEPAGSAFGVTAPASPGNAA